MKITGVFIFLFFASLGFTSCFPVNEKKGADYKMIDELLKSELDVINSNKMTDEMAIAPYADRISLFHDSVTEIISRYNEDNSKEQLCVDQLKTNIYLTARHFNVRSKLLPDAIFDSINENNFSNDAKLVECMAINKMWIHVEENYFAGDTLTPLVLPYGKDSAIIKLGAVRTTQRAHVYLIKDDGGIDSTCFVKCQETILTPENLKSAHKGYVKIKVKGGQTWTLPFDINLKK